MKNTAIVKTIGKLSLALFMLASVNAVAQKDDDEPVKEATMGYVITLKNDTIKGEVIERDKKTGLRLDDDKVRLIISPTEKKTFSPGKIKSYFNGEYTFESVEFKDGEFTFMQPLAKGVLTLYQLDVERLKKGVVEVTETQYYLKKTADKQALVTKITYINFRKETPAFIKDHEEMVDEINSKDLVYEDLEKLVKDYNTWAADKKKK